MKPEDLIGKTVYFGSLVKKYNKKGNYTMVWSSRATVVGVTPKGRLSVNCLYFNTIDKPYPHSYREVVTLSAKDSRDIMKYNRFN